MSDLTEIEEGFDAGPWNNLPDRTQTMSTFCDCHFDGLGTECRRCGCWRRGTEPPDCPPYITRCEPDGTRLPHIKTAEENSEIFRRELELSSTESPRGGEK